MSSGAPTRAMQAEPGFRHEALLYSGETGFVSGLVPFLQRGLAAGEPALVIVQSRRIDQLRAALPDADRVHFADMGSVGQNPARIIPAWQEFYARHAAPGRRLRGIGEPVWPDRRPDEVVECQHHEALLNLAFADAGGFWLLCPYDTAALDPAVLADAVRTHPYVDDGNGGPVSPAHGGSGTVDGLLEDPLPEPPPRHFERWFDGASLGELRTLVSRNAAALGCGTARTADFVLAVHEAATNSVQHGGGEGRLRLWHDDSVLVCEIRDRGQIDEPLIGRLRPQVDSDRGRGLWIVNHFCDLVQVRSCERGTTVRMHLWRDQPAPDDGAAGWPGLLRTAGDH